MKTTFDDYTGEMLVPHGKVYFENGYLIKEKKRKGRKSARGERMNELALGIENTMTTKEVAEEVAEALNTTKDVVLANARKCLQNKQIEHGKATYLKEKYANGVPAGEVEKWILGGVTE